MKYLAILWDSLLEAIDSKVFYVMVGLSLLTVILVGSISYRAVDVEDDANYLASNFNSRMRYVAAQHGAANGTILCTIENFEATKGNSSVARDARSEPWAYDYRFDMVLKLGGEGSAELPKAQNEQVATAMGQGLQQAMRFYFSYLKNVKLENEQASQPGEFRYHVTTRGSRSERMEDWPHTLKVLFAVPITRAFRVPLGAAIKFIEDTLVNTWGAAVALLLSCVITAFFIPNMLRKGTIDLLLVKPVSRATLLTYKYIGGMSFMLLNTVVIVAGIWLVLGVRSHMWGAGFLLSIFVLTFEFAIFYAVSTLFAVLTRSAIVCILMAFLTWAILFVVGWGYRIVDATRKINELESISESAMADDDSAHLSHERAERPLPDWAYTTADIVHFVLPRMKDFDVLITKVIDRDTLSENNPERKADEKLYSDFNWWEATSVSGAYIVLFLGIACWRFSVKDY